jgi:hypothetical protein
VAAVAVDQHDEHEGHRDVAAGARRHGAGHGGDLGGRVGVLTGSAGADAYPTSLVPEMLSGRSEAYVEGQPLLRDGVAVDVAVGVVHVALLPRVVFLLGIKGDRRLVLKYSNE